VLATGQSVIVTFDDGREEPGRIVYRRMDPASGYSQPEAFSVFLDSKRNARCYCGTMFAASKVRAAD
jgi:hypothetical protein